MDKLLSLHYGIWDAGTKSFSESLINTNRVLMEISGISGTDRVLDAGCGIGGTAFFINDQKQAEVIGISLSQKQIDLANEFVLKNNLADKLSFKVMDFKKTDFADDSFDVVWACESVCQTTDKESFMKECYRILRKGGRLILSDYFLTKSGQEDKKHLIKKWCNTWAMSNLNSLDFFTDALKCHEFISIKVFDYTGKIMRSSRRMMYSSLIGALPSELYNLFNPSVSKFARAHYRSGFYQYRALKEDLWKYVIIFAIK